MHVIEHFNGQLVNKLLTKNFAERLRQANLVWKNNIADFVKKDIFSWKTNKH